MGVTLARWGYVILGLVVLGITIRLQDQVLRAMWKDVAEDMVTPAPLLLALIAAALFVMAWPAVVALWLGWHLAPPVGRWAVRVSGRGAPLPAPRTTNADRQPR